MKLVVDIHKRLGDFQLDSKFDTEDLITGFLGASGCGKSMTLKCIAGIETPDSGYIEFDNKVLFDSEKKINIKPKDRKIGYLFQNYALFPTMTVKKNILCGLRQEKNKEEREKKYNSIIELLHLEGLENHRPNQLSGGQAQRTALARMLVNSPELLLFDEPFSALDSFLRKNIQTELMDLLQKLGRQAIIVTHSQREVRRMSSKLYVMDGGHIIQGGRTEDVFNSPNSEKCAVLLEEY